MSLARLGLPGLCRSLLRGLCLLVGEHLLLDEHTVGLRGVLLLGHVHAFLMAQLVASVDTRAWISWARLMSLSCSRMLTVMAFAPPDGSWKVRVALITFAKFATATSRHTIATRAWS